MFTDSRGAIDSLNRWNQHLSCFRRHVRHGAFPSILRRCVAHGPEPSLLHLTKWRFPIADQGMHSTSMSQWAWPLIPKPQEYEAIYRAAMAVGSQPAAQRQNRRKREEDSDDEE